MDAKYVLKFKIWLETADGKGILGDGKWELLKLIREEGSLMAAVDKKGYSYRKTWNKLKDIEIKLGFKIMQKTRGGASGGSTVLTRDGEKLVAAFDNLHKNLDGLIKNAFSEFNKSLL